MRRRRLGLLLGILVLSTAPGCRVVAGAAILLGEAALDAALDGDDDGDSCDRDSRRSEKRPAPRRAPAAPRDPCR